MEVSKRKKGLYIRGAVGLVAAALLLVFTVEKLKRKDVDTTEGIKYIEQEEKADIADIEKKIQSLDSAEGSEQSKKNYKALFENTVIMGDSIAESIEEFNMLNSSSVVAEIGASVRNLDKEIELVKNINPHEIFLIYGLNDISTTNGNTGLFIERYEKLIRDLNKAVPGAKLYVNAIFPVQEKALTEYPEYKYINEYNIELKKMCEKLNLTYMDNASLVSENDYEPDGIHFKASFYTKWLDKIAEVAAL